MIPYYILYAVPNEDARDNNIFNEHNFCEKNKLHNEIINFIVNYMYDFTNKDYGHNIIINSFDEFCEKYCEIKGIKMRYWSDVFQVFYFDNNKWIEWEMNDYKDAIYSSYNKII